MARNPVLGPAEQVILYDIGLYRLLSVQLLQRLGHGTATVIRQLTGVLLRQGLIGSTGDPRWAEKARKDPPKIGVRHVFWLTPKGARELEFLHGREISKGSRRRFKDDSDELPHRLGVVAVHMAFRAWARATGKHEIAFMSDFEPGTTGKTTAVPFDTDGTSPTWQSAPRRFYTPDGYGWFRFADTARRPQQLVIEFERGGYRHDTSLFFSPRSSKADPRPKIEVIRAAAENEVVEEHFDPDQVGAAVPFLVVFATDKMRDDALVRWPDPGAEVWRRFFIKSLPEVTAPGADFSRGWWRPDRSRPNLYPDL